MKYIKQLDSIRTIAVFLVVICHWLPENKILDDGRLGTFGAIGVDVFFVLSGFLISGILLREKAGFEKGYISKKHILKNFYIRRALRIFPIFYLVIFTLFILRFFFRDINLTELAFSASYTVNFYFFKMKYWSGYTTHLWSLAVEEQFYLVWPMLLVFINRKYIPHVIGAFIIIGAVSQMFLEIEFGYLVTFACFDAFGLGALLAWMLEKKPERLPGFFRFISVLALISAIIIAIEFYLQRFFYLPQRTLHAICALWLITYVLVNHFSNKQPLLYVVLSNRFLVYLGKISYGIYLYHLYIPYIRDFVLSRIIGDYTIVNNHRINSILFFLFDLLLLIIVARVSWFIIEQPVLRFKKYFQNESASGNPSYSTIKTKSINV